MPPEHGRRFAALIAPTVGLKRIIVHAIADVQNEPLVSHAESQLSREYKDEFFAGEWSKLSE